MATVKNLVELVAELDHREQMGETQRSTTESLITDAIVAGFVEKRELHPTKMVVYRLSRLGRAALHSKLTTK